MHKTESVTALAIRIAIVGSGPAVIFPSAVYQALASWLVIESNRGIFLVDLGADASLERWRFVRHAGQGVACVAGIWHWVRAIRSGKVALWKLLAGFGG